MAATAFPAAAPFSFPTAAGTKPAPFFGAGTQTAFGGAKTAKTPFGAGAQSTLKCSQCGAAKDKGSYSQNQLSKAAQRRCKACVEKPAWGQPKAAAWPVTQQKTAAWPAQQPAQQPKAAWPAQQPTQQQPKAAAQPGSMAFPASFTKPKADAPFSWPKPAAPAQPAAAPAQPASPWTFQAPAATAQTKPPTAAPTWTLPKAKPTAAAAPTFQFQAPTAAAAPAWNWQAPAPKAAAAPAAAKTPQGPVHTGITCDLCQTPNINGARYKCMCCPNFDVCEGCVGKVPAAPQTAGGCRHDVMVRVCEPRWMGIGAEALQNQSGWAHPGFSCSGCGVATIVGRRYTCTVCDDVHFCERCDFCGVHAAAGRGSHPMLRVTPAACQPAAAPVAAAPVADNGLCFCCGLPHAEAAAKNHKKSP